MPETGQINKRNLKTGRSLIWGEKKYTKPFLQGPLQNIFQYQCGYLIYFFKIHVDIYLYSWWKASYEGKGYLSEKKMYFTLVWDKHILR